MDPRQICRDQRARVVAACEHCVDDDCLVLDQVIIESNLLAFVRGEEDIRETTLVEISPLDA